MRCAAKLLRSDRCSVYVITVGTPIGPDKRTQVGAIVGVVQAISERLQPNDLVILRSTVRVGVTREIVKPILDQAGVTYHLAFCPERTIEGSALQELRQLPQIVGGIDAVSRDLAADFFARIATEVITVESVEAAELVKLLNNTERDLRFAFANEVAAMCEVIGVAAHDVINACNHRYARSNLSLPGPVGGPCLTKDPYILAEGLQTHGLMPHLALVGRETNEAVVGNAVESVHNALRSIGATTPVQKVAVLGLAFQGAAPRPTICAAPPSSELLRLRCGVIFRMPQWPDLICWFVATPSQNLAWSRVTRSRRLSRAPRRCFCTITTPTSRAFRSQDSASQWRGQESSTTSGGRIGRSPTCRRGFT